MLHIVAKQTTYFHKALITNADIYPSWAKIYSILLEIKRIYNFWEDSKKFRAFFFC